ncbi:hypothetical protein M5C99_20815 [Acidovorax sp. NCPPB 2350]|nr:hypothetical protein M5C99_20815 [Acidovorax sp. NCPPB 2350]
MRTTSEKPYCPEASMAHDPFGGSPCAMAVFRPRAGSHSKHVKAPESDGCSTRPWLSRQNAWLTAIDASIGLGQ